MKLTLLSFLISVVSLFSLKVIGQEIVSEATFGASIQRSNFYNYEGPSTSINVDIFQVNSAIGVNGVCANANGDIYAGSWDNLLYAFTKDLKLKWTFKTDGKIRRGPLVINNSEIYFGSTDGYFYSIIDLGNIAKLNWKFKTDSAIWSYPIIDKFENIYFGSDDKYIYSLTHDGQLNWKYGPLNSWPGDGVAISNDGNIVFGTWDGMLIAIDKSGNLLWKNMLGGSIRAMPAISTDNKIYVGSTDGHLYSFDIKGKQIFKLKIDGAIRNSIAISENNYIFFGTANNSRNGTGGTGGTLYKINHKGEIIWKVETNHVFSGGILDKDSNFYCGSDNGEIYCYDSNGNLSWTYDRDYPKILVERITSPNRSDGHGGGGEIMVLTKEGTIIFGSDIGLLYTIKK